jgi:hypothetical protein
MRFLLTDYQPHRQAGEVAAWPQFCKLQEFLERILLLLQPVQTRTHLSTIMQLWDPLYKI